VNTSLKTTNKLIACSIQSNVVLNKIIALHLF
jgi:hypothetical protein